MDSKIKITNSRLTIGLLTPAVTGYNAIDSGIGQHFADLAVGLAELGHTVIAVTPAPAADIPLDPQLAAIQFAPFDPRMPAWLDRLAGLRWQLHSLAGLRHRIRAAARTVAACAAREKLDVIETTSSGALALDYVRRHSHVPIVTRVSTTAAQLVAHNAGDSRWPDRVEQRWEERLVRASDRLVTHTIHHRDELCRAWDLSANAFTIIPHGIALPPREALVSHSDRGTINVLYVGRFEHRKGIDVLLGLIPGLLEASPEVSFTLVGQDSGGQWQRKFWEENPNVDRRRVTFAGVVPAEKLRACYRDCDVLVAPSRYESFGLIFVEAMAWGKPAIGCRAGGMPEVIDEGRTGLLAEPGEPASLRAALLRLIQTPALREQMGMAARQRAETHFSRATLAARSADFYGAIAGPIRTRSGSLP